MISDTHPRGSDALAGSLPSPRHGSAASAEQHSSEPQSSATQAAVALATEAPATAVTRPPPERSDPSPPPSPPRSQASPSTPPTDSSDLEAAREYYAAFRRRLAEAYEQQPQQPADVLLDDPATVSLMQSIAEHVPERDSKTLPSLDELVQIRFKADRHLQSSELYKAEPFLCRLAWNALIRLGPDHPVTLDTVHEIVINQVLRARTEYSVQSWLLPRFAAHFGVDHPDAQQLVTYAAIGLYRIKDPRTEPDLMTAATDVAVRLPHGLGWGPRATPLPDEDAFNRHAVMMAKAQDIMSQGEGHYKLAKDMLTRCVAYYEQLGLHWLGTPRKVRCMMLIGDCISEMDGDAAAQQYLFTAKRTAQNELGYEHILTTQISWEYGLKLMNQDKFAQAFSVFHRIMRTREEVMGPMHPLVIQCKVGIGMALITANKPKQAEPLLQDACDSALKVQGPRGGVVNEAIAVLYCCLLAQSKEKDAAALKRRLRKLGCDVDTYCRRS